MEPIRQGELKANDAVIFFDNICDNNGRKLTKSEKRSRLKDLMKEVYDAPDVNVCILSDGSTFPLIVCRQNPGRAKFYYFNNIDAPEKEVLQTFAQKTGITCKQETYPEKCAGELIANDAKQLLDEVCENGVKLTGTAKLEKLHDWFKTLYNTPQSNRCLTPKGEVPIIVKRRGVNNKTMLCLNTSEYQTHVMAAFARCIGAVYLKEKENAEPLLNKNRGELTARECARIFHNVPNCKNNYTKKDASPKLVEWFEKIYNRPDLNTVSLPSGEKIPLLVRRQSVAQQCICLNTADEARKPFVIRRMAAIIRADICLDNLKLSAEKPQTLHKTMFCLKKAEYQAENPKDQAYYHAYAQKVYETLSLPDKEITLSEYLKKHFSGKFAE
ncbi:MAG: hypothetical protein J6C85_02870 [Alphaproteobacteria bacterium]|nr:hypothetical protein [Alphaproteobacteria bacterium]